MIGKNYSSFVITKKGLFGAKIAKQYKYKAFGETKYESGTYNDNHKFTGKELDETGLYYFGARYYDKGIGRFTSCDPANSGHSYNYTPSNPTNFSDPMGLMYSYTQGLMTYLDTGPSIAEWNARAAGLGSDFVDASGQIESWNYTDLWMSLERQGVNEDLIGIAANIINQLYNPLYNIEGFNFEGLNLGNAAETIGRNWFLAFIYVGKDKKACEGMYSPGEGNSIFIAPSVVHSIGLVSPIEYSLQDCIAVSAGVMAHELTHVALFSIGVQYRPTQENEALMTEHLINKSFGLLPSRSSGVAHEKRRAFLYFNEIMPYYEQKFFR